MSVPIQDLAAQLSGTILIMFIKETQATFDKRDVWAYIVIMVMGSLEHHHTELQYGIPLMLEPRVIFHSFIVICRSLPAVFRRIRKPKILNLFGETRSIMPPVYF